MNDRFKFRVWDKIHKRYIYCDFAGYCSVDYLGKGEKRIVFMPSGVEQIKNGKPLLYAKEDEAKIEQCTGLKDKNGKLIYEGDILQDSEQKILVKYDVNRHCFMFEYQDTRAYKPICDIDVLSGNFEVIGNIHENEDLLE